jgi:hypothetical protein
MTTRYTTFIQATGIFFIFMFFPCTAYLQEQKELPVPQQEQTATEPSQQEPGQLITPDDETSTELEDMKQDQDVLLNTGGQAAEPQGPARETAQGNSRAYIIKRGDTLWDISSSFLKDPFLWPFIWKANPFITNPDLIYPGNQLAIPSLAPIERALKASEEAEPKEKLAENNVEEEQIPQPTPQSPEVMKPKPMPSQIAEEKPATKSSLIVPEEQPVPIIDKYAMLHAGFVNSEDMYGTIVGSPDAAKTLYGFDDTVFVKFTSTQNVHIGDKFLIYTTLHKVYDPATGKRFGNLIRGLGILQIIAMDTPKVLTAQITLSFDTIEKGNQVTPYQEPALIFNSPQRKDKDVSGYILDVTDDRRLSGQLDFVYLDRGSAEGVELGDRFIVFKIPEEKSFPKVIAGEVRVFIVKEHTATAVVTKSTKPIVIGDQVQFKK